MFPTTNFRPAVVHLCLLCGIIITIIAILDNWGWTESCLFQQQGRPRKAQQGTAVSKPAGMGRAVAFNLCITVRFLPVSPCCRKPRRWAAAAGHWGTLWGHRRWHSLVWARLGSEIVPVVLLDFLLVLSFSCLLPLLSQQDVRRGSLGGSSISSLPLTWGTWRVGDGARHTEALSPVLCKLLL